MESSESNQQQQPAAPQPVPLALHVNLPTDLVQQVVAQVNAGAPVEQALANFVAQLVLRGMGVSFGPPPDVSRIAVARQVPPAGLALPREFKRWDLRT